MIPGFIEGHGHFTGVGEAQLKLNLMKAQDVGRDRRDGGEGGRRRRSPVQWISGRGWHQEKWTTAPDPNVEGFPTARVARSRVAEQPRDPDARERPRELRQRKAMELSGITREHAESDGRRDSQGRERRSDRACCARPRSGWCATGAGEPPPTAEEAAARARKVLELADQEVLSKGITSFQDAGSSFATIDLHEEDDRRRASSASACG